MHAPQRKNLIQLIQLLSLALGIAQFSTCGAIGANFLVTCLNGNAIWQFDDTGATAEYLSVSSPTGIALDSSGTLYVASLYDNAIYKVAPDKSLTPFVTGLNHPYGMAFNSQGDLLVANNGTFDILRITPSGNVSVFATVGTHPANVAFDAQGNLYTERNNTTLAKIRPDGNISTFATGLMYPIGMAFDQSGTLYLSDAGTRQDIVKITPGGAVSSFVPGNTLEPYGLLLASDGLLYVADNRNGIDSVDLVTGTTRAVVPIYSYLASPAFMVEVPEPTLPQLGLSLACAAILWQRRR